MSTEIRSGIGNGRDGGRNEGWNPPTVSTKSGLSPHVTSRPIPPSMVIVRIRESKSFA